MHNCLAIKMRVVSFYCLRTVLSEYRVCLECNIPLRQTAFCEAGSEASLKRSESKRSILIILKIETKYLPTVYAFTSTILSSFP